MFSTRQRRAPLSLFFQSSFSYISQGYSTLAYTTTYMQKQTVRTETSISLAQSVAVVQTLLRAGLGCITFMRDLLPQDNFTESHLTTAEDDMSFSSSSSSTFSTPINHQRNVNGFKIMTMSRGYTDEADRILNYLEFGIFDALQKQYLRSFIFAIYLDNKDPNNIVEAYTFNFNYHTIEGTDTTIPIMSLGDGLKKMSLRGHRGDQDPAAEAAKRGKIPTLKDVKRSVKTLLKTLITSMTQMDVLPKRRFASFKIFYTDDTPPEYEPPHFKAGDYERDKWYFTTHDFDELPDTWSVGKVNSGHHSVDVSVSSIATYLPSSTEHENAPFAGTTNGAPPRLTPIEEATHRAEQSAKQMEDAQRRNVVWAADAPEQDEDADADADIDPDYVRQTDGSYVPRPIVPIGLRNTEHQIEPISIEMDTSGAEVHFCGSSQSVPTNLKDVITRTRKAVESSDITLTQPVEETQVLVEDTPRQSSPDFKMGDDADSVLCTPTPAMRPTTVRPRILSPESSIASLGKDFDPEMMKRLALDNSPQGDSEMLDLETQIVACGDTQTADTIESFGSHTNGSADEIVMHSIESSTVRKRRKKKVKEEIVECECGVSMEDGCCACESGCERWYHLWCMGYHSEKDKRLPDVFVCFDCRVHADPSWELIKVDLYPTMMSKFRELACFRRAIKIAEKHNPGTAAEFAKAMGCDNALARQLFKRLENEGFIVEQEIALDDAGFVQTRTRTAKNKGKAKQKPRKNMQKPKFIFNRQVLSTEEYKKYFNPDHEVESRLLGLPQSKASLRSHKIAPRVPQHDPLASAAVPNLLLTPLPLPDETLPRTQTVMTLTQSQTQDELEAGTRPISELKRPGGPCEDDLRPKKKVKISIAPAIDLAD